MALTDGLKALYHWNGNALDSSGNGNNGTIVGATFDSVNQKLGSACVDVDGADDRIECGSDASIDDLTVKSISTWINPANFGELGAGRIITKAATNSNGFSLLVQEGAGTLERILFMQDFSGGLAQWATPNFSISVSAGFIHIALIYDSSSTANDPIIYIQGVSQTITETVAPSGTVNSDAANDLWIGARNNGGTDREFNGLIDEMGLWDRALTAGEVAKLYNGGAGIEIGVAINGRRRRMEAMRSIQ